MKKIASLLVASLAMMGAVSASAQTPVYTKTNVSGYPVEVPAEYTASFLAAKATTTVVEFTKTSGTKAALVASTDGGNYFYANITLADNRLGFDYIMDNGQEGWFTKTKSPYTDLNTTVRVAFTQNAETGLLNLYDAETGEELNSTNVSSNSAWGGRSFGSKGANHVYIGGYVDGNGNSQYVFPGTIASVRLFDTQLTPGEIASLSWNDLKDTDAQADPAQVAFNAWHDLVMVDMKAVAEAYGNVAPTTDVAGKKPAAVAAAVVNYYKDYNWYFGFMGFGNDWEFAKTYFSNYGSTIEAEYAEALAIWQAYVDAPVVEEVVVPVEEYPLNFDKNLKMNHGSRYTSSVSLQVDGQETQTISIPNATQYMLVYNDLHEQTFTVPAGAVVTPTIGYVGEWMHGYVYLDTNNNKQFEVSNDYMDLNDELVSFSFYSPTDNATGYNSAGELKVNSCNAKLLPTFVTPSEPGSYRMRYIVDWNCIDPAGQYGSKYSGNYINANGGVVVDVTLVVEEGTPADPNVVAYPEWKALHTYYGPVDDIAYEYNYKKLEADEVGKKPAAVVNPIIEIYENRTALAYNADPVTVMNILATAYNTTIVADIANTKAALAAYEAAEIVTEIKPVYVEPVLGPADVSDQVAYYIYTTARGGLTVTGATATGLVGTSEAGVGQSVDPTDPRQQFVFVNWQDKLYLYNVATQKFLGKGTTNKGLFTDKPVDPILFKNAGNGTVMLYFDNSHNFNLGGSKQVTIDGWYTKDAGNSFIIKVAEPFDQTPIIEFLNYHEWNGNVLYPETPNYIDDLLDFDLEFDEARSVEEAPYGVLGAIFDETGDAYAVVLGDRFIDEPLTINEGKVTVHFTKISEIPFDLQEAARKVVARATTPEHSKAKVVICGKSFLVDGENVYGDIIVKNYDLDGHGALTGIEAIQTAPAATIYDLQGRRVRNARGGLYIQNGTKVIK